MEVLDEAEQWDALRRGGPNGLFMVVLGLAWWAAALDNVSGNEELCGALDDATWVMQHIISSLKIGREGQPVKRAGDSGLDTALAKRWAPFNLEINLVLTAVSGHESCQTWPRCYSAQHYKAV